MNLYDLTLAAASDVSTFRHPDLDAWIAAIDPILRAAGESSIGMDTVEDITLSDDTLTIVTAYSVRGCPDTTSISLPVSILLDSHPLKAANTHRLNRDIAVAKERLAEAQRVVQAQSDRIAALRDHLEAYRNTAPE